jgi:hypothetical protein
LQVVAAVAIDMALVAVLVAIELILAQAVAAHQPNLHCHCLLQLTIQ